jgi:phosphoglucosamine mutase
VPRLFGTDGVRGIANDDLGVELAVALGRAGATVLARRSGRRPRLLLGRDTRRSGPLLECAFAAGAMSVGADVLTLGVATTPSVAYLVRVLDVDAGVVISASHNPAPYNGIKFFSHDGFKLPDALEDEIAALVAEGRVPAGSPVGELFDRQGELGRYLDRVAGLAGDLSGLRIVMDCANGAAYALGPAALRRAGARVEAIAASPDGLNINDGCGSQHPEALQREVVARGADLGLAFDGDGDRLIAVDETGAVVDGDGLLAVLACDLLGRDELAGRTVVGTVMSNFGLELCLRAHGARLLRTRVGDRYVLEEMRRGGYVLGGEPSGHIILLRHHTTGDGLVTAAALTALLVRTGRRLSELARVLPRLPQRLVNVRVRDAHAAEGHPEIVRAVAEAEAALGPRGRVVVRPSGTEPVVRVMVEAEDADLVEATVRELAARVAGALGALEGLGAGSA